MRKRALLWLPGLALVALALFLTDSLLWQPGLTEDNVRRLRPGMTLAEVEALLGGPATETIDWQAEGSFISAVRSGGPARAPATFARTPWGPGRGRWRCEKRLAAGQETRTINNYGYPLPVLAVSEGPFHRHPEGGDPDSVSRLQRYPNRALRPRHSPSSRC